MKITVLKSALYATCVLLSKVINNKNSIPALDCFLFDFKDNTAKVTASDGENILSTKLEIIDTDEDRAILIPANLLLNSLKFLDEQMLSIDINNLFITITHSLGKFELMGSDSTDYPLNKNEESDNELASLKTSVMESIIDQSLFAIGNDDLRPIMNGISFKFENNSIETAASDGHKLVRLSFPIERTNEETESNKQVILSSKTCKLIKSMCVKEHEMNISQDASNAIIKCQDYVLISRRIEGRYPNYNAVIPQNHEDIITISRTSLLTALKRVSVFTSANQCIGLKFQEEQLVIKAEDIDYSTSAEERITCDYKGSGFDIGFKADYLMNIIEKLKTEEILLKASGPTRAGVFEPTDNNEEINYTYLLMPIMLNN